MKVFLIIVTALFTVYLLYRYSTKDEREAKEGRNKMLTNAIGYAVTKKLIETRSDVYDSIIKKFIYYDIYHPDSAKAFAFKVDSLVREGKKISINDF